MTTPQPQPPFFFFHLPRTAGTTLNAILRDNFAPEEVLTVYRREEYAAGALPETLRAEDAEFLLAVETAVDGTQSRALYGPEQETQSLETLFEGDKGFLQMQYTQLEWPQQSN